MSVRAVLQGALIGLGCAFVMAMVVALVDYQFLVPRSIEVGVVWAGAGLTAFTAGWAGGRLADRAGWFHGALAAITLNLVATVIGETIKNNAVNHLWLGLGLAFAVGLAGGLMGSALQ